MFLLKKKTFSFYLFALLIISIPKVVFSQLTVNNTFTPAQLVQSILLGPGISATNITYNGDATAIGSFGGSSNIGFPSGVIMATGAISNAIGPNNTGSQSSSFFTTSTDSSLASIASGSLNDAAILEFDFVPLSDTVKFRYVFGSEEYMEFANSSFNDVFGFFITGPNPGGGNYSSQNIALIPGTNTPVSINNVNLTNNSAYYFDNGDGSGTGTAPDGQTIQYDGFTLPLTAIAPVICGQTYHIKIAIADVTDASFDSGVFLEAQSFSSPGVSIIPQFSYGNTTDTTLYEGCGNACVLFVRGGSLAAADTINLTIGGVAVNGTDYYLNSGGPGTPFPSQIIFPIGEDSLSYCITAVSDNVTEGPESIVFTVPAHSIGACVQPAISATIYINEYSPILLSVSNDTTLCNSIGPVTIAAIVNGGVPPYTYSWTNVGGTAATSVVNPTVNTTYKVTVNDACSGTPDPTPAVTDSVKISLVSVPSITTTVSYGGSNDSTVYEGCGQLCIHFVRFIGVGQACTYTLQLSGTANSADYTGLLPNQLVFAAGQDSLSYCIDASADGITDPSETLVFTIDTLVPCNLSISKTIHIQELPNLTLSSAPDTTLNCVTGPITLFANVSGGLPPYTYTWSNGAGNVSTQTLTPNTSTVYSVTVSDACSGTPDPTPNATANTYVTLNIPSPLIVNAGADITVCPDDVYTLTANVTGGALPLSFLWSTSTGPDSAQSPSAISTNVHATATTLFTFTVTDNCNNTQTDQITANVEHNCLLNMPNVISPDGQGPIQNETFYIENLDRFPPSSLIIYNRYGNKLFETNNYTNNWNGAKYSDGTYFYVLTVPAAGQVIARAKKSNQLGDSYSEALVGTDKVFTGFFQLVRAK